MKRRTVKKRLSRGLREYRKLRRLVAGYHDRYAYGAMLQMGLAQATTEIRLMFVENADT